MQAKVRGTEIYFDIASMQLAPVGEDFVERPILFLLQGGPGGDHLRFKQHSLELQEVAQLVFIDHRGCGRSKRTQQSEYTLENNVEDIEALRLKPYYLIKMPLQNIQLTTQVRKLLQHL